MPNILHIIFVSFIIILVVIAGCSLIAAFGYVTRPSRRDGYRSSFLKVFLFRLPTGYVYIYGIFSIGYTVSFGHSSAASDTTAIIAVFVGAIVFIFLLNRGWTWDSNKEIKSATFILILLFSVTVVPQLVLGVYPFAVTDKWTHISYINRLLIENSTVVSGAWLPNEIYAIKFAPHHAFLASIGRFTGSTAIEVWIGASFILPALAVLSYLSFVESAFPDLVKCRSHYFFFILSFVLLFRISADLFRGTADYRIVSCIIFFQIARYLILSVSLVQKSETIAASFIACALMALLSITHLVEVMILLLMFAPYFLVRAVAKQNIKPIVVFTVWSTFSVVAGMTTIHWFFSGFSMPLDKQATLDSYWPFFKLMFEQQISVAVFLTGMIALFILWKERDSCFMFLSCCCVTSFIFSPFNTFLFNKIMHVVGANLAWRIIFVFPTYLAIGAAFGVAHRQISLRKFLKLDRRTLLYSAWTLGAVAAIMLHLYSWWHLDGNSLGYQHSDSVSQLRLFPNLYRELKKYNGKVILSDTITSAPINAITSNYIVTHRPWTEGPETGRFSLAKETLKNPSMASIRRMNISLLVVNTAPLPLKLHLETVRYPWLRDDFYMSREEYKQLPFLQFHGEFDGVDIYEVDQSKVW